MMATELPQCGFHRARLLASGTRLRVRYLSRIVRAMGALSLGLSRLGSHVVCRTSSSQPVGSAVRCDAMRCDVASVQLGRMSRSTSHRKPLPPRVNAPCRLGSSDWHLCISSCSVSSPKAEKKKGGT